MDHNRYVIVIGAGLAAGTVMAKPGVPPSIISGQIAAQEAIKALNEKTRL